MMTKIKLATLAAKFVDRARTTKNMTTEINRGPRIFLATETGSCFLMK